MGQDNHLGQEEQLQMVVLPQFFLTWFVLALCFILIHFGTIIAFNEGTTKSQKKKSLLIVKFYDFNRIIGFHSLRALVFSNEML